MYGNMVIEDMNYTEFMDYAKENFKDVLAQYTDVTGVIFETDTVYKNNRGKMDAFRVRFPDDEAGPQIYFNNMFIIYQEYMEEGQNKMEAALKVLHYYAKDMVETRSKIQELLKPFIQHDLLRDKWENLHMCIIGYEKNKEMLQTVPHRKFLDMAIVYRIFLSDQCSLPLTNKLVKGITEEELYESALKKLEEEVQVRKIGDIVPAASCGPGADMLILSNRDMRYGATAIFSKYAWQKAVEMYQSNFYIIPSSVHECIALPDFSCGDDDRESEIHDYYNMLKEVNDWIVNEEEILTYSVYYYDRQSGEISILKNHE